MRKASRLFEIIQTLRAASGPVTAATMAKALGVTIRSIYRDVAALQAMRVPVEGGRGIGYILRPGFTLPPLMFSIEETEAIVLALALLRRTGDQELKQATARINQKIAAAMPAPLRQALQTTTVEATTLYAWGTITPEPDGVDLAAVRRCIRDEQKLSIDYRAETGTITQRIIRPLALIYYLQSTNIIAWCELRQAIRQFRADRIDSAAPAQSYFRGEGNALRQTWIDGWATGTTER
jgi:predicted DNA-binding transcriptional regulator YafY